MKIFLRLALHLAGRLLAFLVISVFLVSHPLLSQTVISYQSDINRWKAQDVLDFPPSGAVLFVGSSSIRRWEQLTRDFADYKVIQRGFGGSVFSQLNEYVNDIVLPYNPRAIVVWSGTNDINNGSTGASVLAQYQAFVSTVLTAQPAVDIFYLGIIQTPGTKGDTPKTTERLSANSLITNFIATSGDARLHYIDLPSYFENLTSTELSALFVDSLHLTRAAYDSIWKPAVRSALGTVITPNKPFLANPNSPAAGARLLFDFGPSDTTNGDKTLGVDANGSLWNNWHPASGAGTINAGEHLGNLVTTAGVSTGIDLTITGGFSSNGKLNGGLLSPNSALLGSMAIATATEDYFYSTADGLVNGGSDDVPGGFMLDGLNPNLLYDFRFFGSRTASDTRQTIFDVIGSNSGSATLKTSGLNIGNGGTYSGNNDQFAAISGIRPNAYGEIFIDLTAVQSASTFAYINAMEVTVISAFDGWTRTRGLPAGATLADSSSANGATYLQHYALDTNPLGSGGTENKQTNALIEDAGKTYLAFTFPVRKGAVFSGNQPASASVDGIVYQVFGDDNLQGSDLVVAEWPAVDHSQMPALGDYNNDGQPDYEFRTFRLLQPVGTSGRGFIWVGISTP